MARTLRTTAMAGALLGAAAAGAWAALLRVSSNGGQATTRPFVRCPATSSSTTRCT